MVSGRAAKYGFGICVLIILLYLTPHFILGQNSYITIHDNLDSRFTWYKILVHSGQIFKSHSFVDQIMNGIPRACLPSALNMVAALFLLFKPFTAYIINKLLVHLIAFIGMYLLLKRHFFNGKGNTPVVLGGALCFALLPFYSIYGLTVAGQPLLLYAFLNLLNEKQRILDFFIIFFFAIYSSLVLVGVFILFCFGAFFLYDSFKNKRINIGFLVGLLILGITYVITEHDLIYITFLDKNFVSHRIDYLPAHYSFSFAEAIKLGLSNLLYGQPQPVSSHTFILVISLVTTAILFINKSAFNQNNIRLLFVLLGTLFLISLFYSFSKWDGLLVLKEKIAILRMFQFGRFYWFQSLIWFLIFALVLSIIFRTRHGKYIVFFLIAFQILYSNRMWGEGRDNVKIIAKKIIGRKINDISYSEFFSEELFREIGEFIDIPKEDYRVVNIGIHPAIAQYNGFYTLDGCQNIYPLVYKHKFRRIIENELDKSKKWRRYFDWYGNRCYVFVAELENEGLIIQKEKNVRVGNLDLNSYALKEMGGKYIFSAVEILNAKDNNLMLLKAFERNDSRWKIYLYKVI